MMTLNCFSVRLLRHVPSTGLGTVKPPAEGEHDIYPACALYSSDCLFLLMTEVFLFVSMLLSECLFLVSSLAFSFWCRGSSMRIFSGHVIV
jgi:hypothetical protein